MYPAPFSRIEKGANLALIMLEMIRWGGKYSPNTKAREVVLERIDKDRDGFALELRNKALDRD